MDGWMSLSPLTPPYNKMANVEHHHYHRATPLNIFLQIDVVLRENCRFSSGYSHHVAVNGGLEFNADWMDGWLDDK